MTTYRHKDASANSEGELLIVNSESLKVERILTMRRPGPMPAPFPAT